MRRTSLSLLMFTLLVGACRDQVDDQPVAPSRISLRIVSGDRQVAPVAPAAGAVHSRAPAGLSMQQLPGGLLPEPLVARITVDGQPLSTRSAPSSPLGPSLATLPEDIVVTYRVMRPDNPNPHDTRHCGSSFLDAAKPDRDGIVTTYWERGTWAGECRMEVRLVVDGLPRVDTAFVVAFEPGPVTHIQWSSSYGWQCIGDSVELLDRVVYAFDAYRNEIDIPTLSSGLAAALRWQWVDRVQNSQATGPSGTGLTVTIPDFAEHGFRPRMGPAGYPDRTYFAGGLAVWIRDKDDGYALTPEVFAAGHCPR